MFEYALIGIFVSLYKLTLEQPICLKIMKIRNIKPEKSGNSMEELRDEVNSKLKKKSLIGYFLLQGAAAVSGVLLWPVYATGSVLALGACLFYTPK